MKLTRALRKSRPVHTLTVASFVTNTVSETDQASLRKWRLWYEPSRNSFVSTSLHETGLIQKVRFTSCRYVLKLALPRKLRVHILSLERRVNVAMVSIIQNTG